MSPREIRSGEWSFALAQPRKFFPAPDEEIRPEMLATPQPTDDEIDPDTLAMPQQVPESGAQRRVITIYVRKGDHPKERTVSINPVPERVDPIKLLNAGFALDGNSATLSVDPYTLAGNGDDGTLEVSRVTFLMPPENGQQQEWMETAYSLTKALARVEKALVTWLTKLGFEVKFG